MNQIINHLHDLRTKIIADIASANISRNNIEYNYHIDIRNINDVLHDLDDKLKELDNALAKLVK